jgi:hypothetical protein
MVLIVGNRGIECGERQSVLVLAAQDKPKVIVKARMAAASCYQAPKQSLGERPVLPPQGMLQIVQSVSRHLPTPGVLNDTWVPAIRLPTSLSGA